MTVHAASWFAVSVALSAAALVAWAGATFSAPTAPPSSPSRNEQPARAASGAARAPSVRTLHEQSTSAYHARLFTDEEDVVLVTQTGFTTFRTDGSAEEHTVSLGPVAARQGDALVFWRSGRLREVSLLGGDERDLVVLPRPPQHLLTSEGRLAWIHNERERGASLQTLSGGRVRIVYESAYGASAPVMHGADIYWVAESRDGTWRVGRVNLDGQHPTWSMTHQGRPPAMLAAGPDGVYFYDGPQRGVRRLTFDLEREAAVSAGVVCSPLVVSHRVVCAQVGGLFEVPLSGGTPMFLASERVGPVTALAATRTRALWVADNGAERLILRTVALAEP